MAPMKTVNLGCLMAMIAAMKKVLSPNSDTTITERAATKAWRNPRSPVIIVDAVDSSCFYEIITFELVSF